MKEPKFKLQVFNSIKKFEHFLKENTHSIVEFEDHGQDLTKAWLHESGEILHCDLQARTYNGKFVRMEMLKVGQPFPIIYGPGEEILTTSLIIKQVNKLEHEPA